jgi:hypothetical protein
VAGDAVNNPDAMSPELGFHVEPVSPTPNADLAGARRVKHQAPRLTGALRRQDFAVREPLRRSEERFHHEPVLSELAYLCEHR